MKKKRKIKDNIKREETGIINKYKKSINNEQKKI